MPYNFIIQLYYSVSSELAPISQPIDYIFSQEYKSEFIVVHFDNLFVKFVVEAEQWNFLTLIPGIIVYL